MNIQEANRSPALEHDGLPATDFPHTAYPNQIAVESRIPEEVRAALWARGHLVDVTGPWWLGANCAVIVNPGTGALNAGADSATATLWRGEVIGQA